MDKKKKRKIIILVVCLVLVVAIVLAATLLGGKKERGLQFKIENSDLMAGNAFVENELRADNSLLEYGKVLTKYAGVYESYKADASKGWSSALNISPINNGEGDFAGYFAGISYSYSETGTGLGETVTIYCEGNNKITTVSYKGKPYTYDVDVAEAERDTEDGLCAQKFATEKFLNTLTETLETVGFYGEGFGGFTYTKKVDKTDNRKDGYTSAPLAADRYDTFEGLVFEAQADAITTAVMNGESETPKVDGAEDITFIYKVNVPTSALYSLALDYVLPPLTANNALVSLKVNGKLPFAEAANMELKRTYGFYDCNSLDIAGNEIKAQQQELFDWKNIVMSSPEGTYKNPYRFLLSEGENEIALSFSREPVAIKGISLVEPISTVSYSEYSANLKESEIVKDNIAPIQFEIPYEKSNQSIRMEWDGNYASQPASYEVTRYNYFGGDRWSSGGESASWKFTAPKTGWYQIGFRYQTTLADIVSYREIKIDGEIPFAEMEEYCFPYSDGWLGSSLKDENQKPYYFYLTEGEHSITITSKVGPLRSSVQELEEAMEAIATLVGQVASLTGAIRNESGGYTVDKNRDWDLDRYIIGIQDQMDAYSDTFTRIYNEIKEANDGVLPYYGSSISVAKTLFERLADDLEQIPASLNDINNTLSSLSTALQTITEQPLAIDYMVLTGGDYDYSKCTSNGWQNLYVGSIQFFDSFTKDYNVVGAREETDSNADKEIEVYVARGREYVDMMRNLIAEDFTPNTGIKVNLNMISGSVEGLVMLRYVTGTAPDVAVSVGAGAPVEYAARGALVALNDLNGDGTDDNPEFFELKEKSFLPDAFIPSLYRGNYYSFPETQGWAALFYRTDIIEDELELEIPDTWDDVYEMLPILQENGMDFCYNYGVGGLYPFMYQNGADVYDYNGMKSALDTEVAYNAFVEYAELYTKYNVPYAANFYMKFKMGDMPIGIADMSTYCQLKYSAPEIEGKWAMAPIPGHVTPDGDVDRGMGGSGTVNIIINNKENLQAEESWEFIKWWMSDDVQAEYAAEVEATFGVASRWSTANRNAVERMAYSEEERKVIYEMWDDFTESPIVLGGYYTTRYLTTALNQAVIQGDNARIALEDAVREINKEMKRKQEELLPEGATSVVWKEWREKGDEQNG